MVRKPAEFEVLQRPLWDPAPGTVCLWKCIKEKPLAMHRLSDRVLGSLHIAIVEKYITAADCNNNDSDLANNFCIYYMRYSSNLGRGLLTPDGKAVVSIPTSGKKRYMVLRGSGNETANLPVMRYDSDRFKSKYPNFEQWRDELLYRRNKNGTLHVKSFRSYPKISKDAIPADWPQGLTRDRTLASEVYYRLKNLNPKTGLPKDAVGPSNEVQQATSGPEDRKGRRKAASVAADNVVVISDSEDESGTPANPSEKQKNDAMEHMAPKSLKQLVPSAPAPAPIEVHKAAIRAAFQDKAVSRAELFWTLLPYITLAEAEEILIRRKGEAEVEHK
ncbi:hypothetical protein O988_09153 [Pseudogymnoascus sp. VKM F-3808]|nr:hypothetical protein O988_09153 [Pseudogymnoascus sp. VKM F-3808]